MIAIGGSIGTGLFVASGASISQAGPGGALVAYGLIGIMVYFLMTSLGEMAAYMPVSGSFSTYASRFVDPAFGFAIGWNYWYNWAVTIAVELVATNLVMQFWFPSVPGIVWSGLFLFLKFALNAISVRGFGESEYWFALIKVITLVLFLLMLVLVVAPFFTSTVSPGPILATALVKTFGRSCSVSPAEASIRTTATSAFSIAAWVRREA